MHKPNRHNNHILETESNKFYNNHVPNEWFSDKPENDYGIDFTTNIVINNEVTGLNFSVQLKAKEIEIKVAFVSITLKNSTLNFYNTRLEPILLVAYIQEEKEAYWIWYDDLGIDIIPKNKTTKINIPKTNKLSRIEWNNVVKYVQNRFSIKKLIDGIKLLEYNEISNSEILAWKNYYIENYENASFYFKGVLKTKTNNVISILEGLAKSQYNLYQYSEALQNINIAIEQSGTSNQFLIKACILAEDGIMNYNRGKLIEAKRIFKKFIDNQPNQGEYHYNFANVLRSLGEIDESILQYKISLELNPNYAEAWKNLGSCYYEVKKHDDEINCYDTALRINPNLPQALFSKGVTLCHVYKKYQEGLDSIFKSLKGGHEMGPHFSQCYYWIAYAYEKLNNLKKSLLYINKGLEINPQEDYLLNFKSDLLASNWQENDILKNEALDFFEYKLELENDYKSLYYIIKINDYTDNTFIINLIKKNTQMLKYSNLSIFEKCNISIIHSLSFLSYYDKYLEFRHSYPLNRYINHYISEYYSVSSQFIEIVDLIFANTFSDALAEYYKSNNIRLMEQKILACLLNLPKSIFELLPDEKFSHEDSITIMANIYIEIPKIAVREYGAQFGFLTGKLNIEKKDPEELLFEEWHDKLSEETLQNANKILKILGDD